MSSSDRSARRALAAAAGLAAVGVASLATAIVVDKQEPASSAATVAPSVQTTVARSTTTSTATTSTTSTTSTSNVVVPEPDTVTSTTLDVFGTESSVAAPAPVFRVSSTSAEPRSSHAGPIVVEHRGSSFTFSLPEAICHDEAIWAIEGPKRDSDPQPIKCFVDGVQRLQLILQRGMQTVRVTIDGKSSSSISFEVE
jgi:hypothetical protein